MEQKVSVLLLALAACTLPGCGQGSLLTPEGVPVPPLVEGTVAIPAPASDAVPSSAYIRFTPPAAGEVVVSISWEPFANRVAFAVSVGPCSSVPCPSEIDMGPFTDGATNKPISGSHNLSPRSYTLRIDNWGPAAATCTYSVTLRE